MVLWLVLKIPVKKKEVPLSRLTLVVLCGSQQTWYKLFSFFEQSNTQDTDKIILKLPKTEA